MSPGLHLQHHPSQKKSCQKSKIYLVPEDILFPDYEGRVLERTLISPNQPIQPDATLRWVRPELCPTLKQGSSSTPYTVSRAKITDVMDRVVNFEVVGRTWISYGSKKKNFYEFNMPTQHIDSMGNWIWGGEVLDKQSQFKAGIPTGIESMTVQEVRIEPYLRGSVANKGKGGLMTPILLTTDF